MKLTYRDKVILGIFLAILILAVGFFTLIKPKNQEIKTDKATLETKQSEQREVKAKIATIPDLQTQIKDTVKNTNDITEKFVDRDAISNTVKLDEFMQHYADENNIKLTSLAVGDMSQSSLNYYYISTSEIGSGLREYVDIDGKIKEKIDEAQAEQNALADRAVESVFATQYGIEAKGTKEDLWNYVAAINKSISKDKDAILINSVSYSLIEDDENNQQQVQQPADGEEGAAPTPQDQEESDIIDIQPDDMVSISMVITLYSVYEMPMPDVGEGA